ncbi:MAG: aspartate carbamoyltransferase regulatory subunit [Candidatus Aenigmatarchaeota archaeon]
MNKENENLLVRKIENGTVIDHIERGKGMKIYKLLNLKEETCILLTNVESKKLGRKDILKIADKELLQKDIDKIALIAPNATINIIKNWKVVEKKKATLPNILVNIVSCPNRNCITRMEKDVSTKFIVEKREPIKLRCFYCERIFEKEDFEELFT